MNLISNWFQENYLENVEAEIICFNLFRNLDLGHNQLRILPYELGKLFKLHVLNLKGNPLNPEILSVCSEPNGTSKLLTWLLYHLQGERLWLFLSSLCGFGPLRLLPRPPHPLYSVDVSMR